MFGSALGSEDNGFMVSDGRFANVSSIYDPKSLLTSTDITPVTNSYGYVSAKYDYQVRVLLLILLLQGLSSDKMCGMG